MLSNVAWRENIKNNYPWIYENLLGGSRADEYTQKNLGMQDKVVDTAKTATDVVSGTFDIIAWIKENWQLAVLGLVALLVILRD